MAAKSQARTYRLLSNPLPGVAVVAIATPRDSGKYTVIRRGADVLGFKQDGSDIEYQTDTWDGRCTCLAGQHGRVCKHLLVGRSMEKRELI
jgi:hypothetical protein